MKLWGLTEYYGTFAMVFIVLCVGQFDGFSKTSDSSFFFTKQINWEGKTKEGHWNSKWKRQSYRERPCLHLAFKCDLYLMVVTCTLKSIHKDQDMFQESYEKNWLRYQQKIRHFKTMTLNVQPRYCKDFLLDGSKRVVFWLGDDQIGLIWS